MALATDSNVDGTCYIAEHQQYYLHVLVRRVVSTKSIAELLEV